MVQKSQILLACLASIGPFVLLCCGGLLAGANFLLFIEYGFGAQKNQIYVWKVCLAAAGSLPAECVPTSHKRICTELTSKLNAVGIMTIIAGFNILLTIVSVIADVQGCKVPVKNLTRLFFCWSIVPTALALAVAFMAMTNAQCTATQSLEDQEGEYGPGFQMLFAAMFGMCVGLLFHTCAMHFIGSGTGAGEEVDDFDAGEGDFDEEAELKKIKENLMKKMGVAVRPKSIAGAKKAPGGKAAPKRPPPKPPVSRVGRMLD
jgi:hypothetical protein